AERDAELEPKLAPLRARFAVVRQKGLELAMKAGHPNANDDNIKATLSEPERKEFVGLQGEIAALEAKRYPLPKAYAVTDKGREFGKSYLLLRGDAYHKGPEVQPGFICSLPDGTSEVGATAATAQTTG